MTLIRPSGTQSQKISRRSICWRAVRAVAERDLTVVLRSKGVLLPIVIVPLIMLVILPAAIGFLTPLMDAAGELDEISQFLDMMPPAMAQRFAQYTPNQTMVVFTLIYMFAPLFLILPMMTASTIAAGSFAGEKERKTLEALLYTPTTDLELVLGKLMTAWIPAMAVTFVGFVLYGVVVNVSAWQTMEHIFFPTAMWIVLILWLAPAAAGLGLATMVLVSAKANTFQDAYQLGGMVVLPILMLVFGQLAGVVYLSPLFVFLTGLVLWIVDAVILWFAAKTFRRTEIIARL